MLRKLPNIMKVMKRTTVLSAACLLASISTPAFAEFLRPISYTNFDQAQQLAMRDINCKWVSTGRQYTERQKYDFLCTVGNWGTVTLMLDRVKPNSEELGRVRLIWRAWDPRVHPAAGEAQVAGQVLDYIIHNFIPQKHANSVRTAFWGAREREWSGKYVNIGFTRELREGYAIHKLDIIGTGASIPKAEVPVVARIEPELVEPQMPQEKPEIVDVDFGEDTQSQSIEVPLEESQKSPETEDMGMVEGGMEKTGVPPVQPTFTEQGEKSAFSEISNIDDAVAEVVGDAAPIQRPAGAQVEGDMKSSGTFMNAQPAPELNVKDIQEPKGKPFWPFAPAQPVQQAQPTTPPPPDVMEKQEEQTAAQAQQPQPVSQVVSQPKPVKPPKVLPNYRATIRVMNGKMEINALSAGGRLVEQVQFPGAEEKAVESLLTPRSQMYITPPPVAEEAYMQAEELTGDYSEAAEQPVKDHTPLESLQLNPEQIAPLMEPEEELLRIEMGSPTPEAEMDKKESENFAPTKDHVKMMENKEEKVLPEQPYQDVIPAAKPLQEDVEEKQYEDAEQTL